MKLTNRDLVLQCMERIQILQQHVTHIDDAASYVHRMSRGADVECGNLRRLLIDAELTEWRNLAMWGLTLDDAERDRVKAAVHARFLRDGVYVANWFNGGFEVGSYLTADDDEFREMARAAFAPKAKT